MITVGSGKGPELPELGPLGWAAVVAGGLGLALYGLRELDRGHRNPRHPDDGRARRNARRTWPDGSGCEQRPLHPHAPGCPGWRLSYDGSGEVAVFRCRQCRTFVDDDDAAEHVRGCRACLGLIAVQSAGGRAADDDEAWPMPTGHARGILAKWANDTAASGAAPVMTRNSLANKLARWLHVNGARRPDGSSWLDATPSTARLWHELANWAPESLFEDYAEDLSWWQVEAADLVDD